MTQVPSPNVHTSNPRMLIWGRRGPHVTFLLFLCVFFFLDNVVPFDVIHIHCLSLKFIEDVPLLVYSNITSFCVEVYV